MLSIIKKIIACLALTSLLMNAYAKNISYPPVTVGILVPMEHRAMDEIVAGFKETLTQRYPGKITFLVKNAEGDINLQRSILQSFKQKSIDLYAPIGTQTTQMTLALITSKPVVGIAAEYSQKNDHQRKRNFTLVDDSLSVTKQMQFIHSALPNITEITLVHSPSDKILPEVKEAVHAGKTYVIRVQSLMVQQLSDLYTISQHIPQKSQAIFILKDILVASGIQTLINQANKLHIPVITSDDGTVQNGAAFAVGVSEHQIGTEGGKLAAEILKGKDAGQVPFKTLDHLLVFLNKNAAKQQGLNITDIQAAAKKANYTTIATDELEKK